jgi:HK97 gp10 family phage protein
MTTKVSGMPDVRRALNGLTPKLRNKILLPVLRSAARTTVLATAKQQVPVMSLAASLKAPNRIPGLLKKSLAVRPSKIARKKGNVGVFVNVRPAKGAKYKTQTSRSLIGVKTTRRVLKTASRRGTAADPFYWRFVEFGTSKMRARPFLGPASRQLGAALQLIRRDLAAEFRPDGGGLRRG